MRTFGPALLIALMAPALARAGEVACWFEQGVVVIPASVGGVAGDYILDTGTAATQLADTRAQGAGYVGPEVTGSVRLAGQTLRARAVAVADLDPRTWAFPTPIAGVLGADLLRGFVLDINFQPCRAALYRPGQAPRFRATARLALRLAAGVPVVHAAVADGPRTRAGDFAPATGLDTAVRLDETVASVPGARDLSAFGPGGGRRASLRALSFAGDLQENLPAGLAPPSDSADIAGQIGAPALAAYRLRFDFPRQVLLLAPR